METHFSRPQDAFITQAEDYDGSKDQIQHEPTSVSKQLKALEQENVDLESRLVELRQKINDVNSRISTYTGFAPLASIFPMQRDVFGETKSASQHLKIYKSEWKLFTTRFKRASDTSYTYELERAIERKKERVRSLEKRQTELKLSNTALERRFLKLKSDARTQTDAAAMIDLSSHVTLLREQVRVLEEAEAKNRELFVISEEERQRVEKRYKKMKQVAEQFGVSLKTSNTEAEVKKMYDEYALKLERMQKRCFFKEDQRVKELRLEKSRLDLYLKDKKRQLLDREIDLSRKHSNITTLRKAGASNPKYRSSPNPTRSASNILSPNLSLPLTTRPDIGD